MAKRRKASRQEGTPGRNLSHLPQVADDIWQAGIRRTPAWVRIGGVLQRPWMVLVTSRTRGQVLAHEMPDEPPDAGTVWENLASAMQTPDAGSPHRPAQVELCDERIREALVGELKQIGVDCIVRSELEHLDVVLDDLARHLQGGKIIPCLLDVPGLERRQVGRYFTSAAAFYRRRPWERLAGDTPIRVDCNKFDSGPWYAVVMGQAGMVTGLALHEGEQALEEILRGGMNDADSIRRTSAVSLMFGEKHEIAVKDLDAAEEDQWEVAHQRAYPLAVRVNPGRAIRAPLAWELELLEACLWAIPDFLALDDVPAAQVKIPSLGEDVELRLSWPRS